MFAILYQHRCVDGHVAINVIKLWLKKLIEFAGPQLKLFHFHTTPIFIWCGTRSLPAAIPSLPGSIGLLYTDCILAGGFSRYLGVTDIFVCLVLY